MAKDKDTYLIEPEKILAAANQIAQNAKDCGSWVSDMNSVANDNLDKNLTRAAHNAFNILWSAWYLKLVELVDALEGLAIQMEKGVLAAIQMDKKAALALTNDPNVAAEIDKDVTNIQNKINDLDKSKPDLKKPDSLEPNNNPTDGSSNSKSSSSSSSSDSSSNGSSNGSSNSSNN